MTLDTFLHRLAEASAPSSDAQDRVRARVLRRIQEPSSLALLRDALAPHPAAKRTVWSRVAATLHPQAPVGALDAVRALLTPSASAAQAVRAHVLSRLDVRSTPRFAFLKWTSAIAVVAIALRASPLLFLAPHTEAMSRVLLTPVIAPVEISDSGLWQSLHDEVSLTAETRLRTGVGEATVTLHSYGVVRLAPHTDIVLHDTSVHPGSRAQQPTLTLKQGSVWVQGMVPATLPGILVQLPNGAVEVHEGSLSLSVGAQDVVEVWNRRASVSQGDRSLLLVSGETVLLQPSILSAVRPVAAAAAESDWVQRNLSLDAFHQREIAQLQLERRAAAAGIHPTSPLYPVKRIAEQMDVLLTIGSEAKLQKELAYAETRLNEAAAIIVERAKDESADASDAAVRLAGYRRTLQLVASGAQAPVADAGDMPAAEDADVVQSLLAEYKEGVLSAADGALAAGTGVTVAIVEREVTRNTVELASALPDDEAFLLKKTVLETNAAIAGHDVPVVDVEGQLIIDTLSALQDTVEQGDVSQVEETLAELQPYLDSIARKERTLSPEMQKEADALLSSFATRVVARSEEQGDVEPSLLTSVRTYLPRTIQPTQRVASLTEGQIDQVVAQMLERIDTYTLERSRWNQLQQEFRRIEGHPDQGRILLKLYRRLPSGLTGYARTEIHELRMQRQQALEASHEDAPSSSQEQASSAAAE